jgi:hypothetical protein
MNSITKILTVILLTATCSISTLADGTFNMNTETSGGGATGFSYTAGLLTINENGTYTIEGNGTPVARRILISPMLSDVNITLKDVNIDVSGTDNACAFDMTGATVNLTLEGSNILINGSGKVGLQAPGTPVSTLKITAASSGSLVAYSDRSGAGIGGSYGKATDGSVTITGGSVKMTVLLI